MILIAIGLPAMQGWFLRSIFAAAVCYGCWIQIIGVYYYPKGRWDATPVAVNDDPGRLWNWSDNPVARTIRGGVAWEPYAIVSAGLSGGIPAAESKMQQLGIQPY
jgi:hypothetical protein